MFLSNGLYYNNNAKTQVFQRKENDFGYQFVIICLFPAGSHISKLSIYDTLAVAPALFKWISLNLYLLLFFFCCVYSLHVSFISQFPNRQQSSFRKLLLLNQVQPCLR